MYLYFDESGHTGLKNNDQAQPDYYLCCILSVRSIDDFFRKEHDELLTLCGRNELHGNVEKQISLDQKYRFRKLVRRVLHESGARVFISKINKALFYRIRLAADISSAITPELPPNKVEHEQLVEAIDENFAENYWTKVINKPSEGYTEILLSSCRTLYEKNVLDSDIQARIANFIRQLENSNNQINYCKYDKSIQSLSLRGMLCKITTALPPHASIEKICYDKQYEFRKYFKEIHKEALSYPDDFPLSKEEEILITNLEKLQNSSFTMPDSEKSFGIQLADLMAACFSQKEKSTYCSSPLLEYIRRQDIVRIPEELSNQ